MGGRRSLLGPRCILGGGWGGNEQHEGSCQREHLAACIFSGAKERKIEISRYKRILSELKECAGFHSANVEVCSPRRCWPRTKSGEVEKAVNHCLQSREQRLVRSFYHLQHSAVVIGGQS